MVEQGGKSRLLKRIQDYLMRQFVATATARAAADHVGVNRHTATLYFHKFRKLISPKLAGTEPWLFGEIEVVESCFGGSWKGNR
jgi:transposase